MNQISELFLTDGTTRIDLMQANRHSYGFALKDYVPGRSHPKDGGVWADSPMAEGRQLISTTPTNTTDTLTLCVSYGTHEEIIQAFEEFDLMLDAAADYWTSRHNETPVWVQARARGETNPRYAVVRYADYDENFDPYQEPYLGGHKVSTDDFAFVVERGPWLQFPPGQGESIPISHEKSGTAIQSSIAFESNEGVIIGNMHQATIEFPGSGPNGGLRVIYREDGGVFSSNLLAGSFPYNLFNTPFVINDAAYFGSDYPFFGLVFNTTGTLDTAWIWEFWNGAAWTSLSVTTTFNLFLSPQIGHAYWSYAAVSTWAKSTVSSDTTSRYWIRVRLTTSPSGGGVTLAQINRHIYSTAVGFIEVAAGEIDGTLAALLKIRLHLWDTSVGAQFFGPFFWVGLRDVDRGDEFSAHLNAGGANPDGITVSAVFGNSTLVTDNTSPGGAHLAITNESSMVGVAIFAINTVAILQYRGRFRLFVRLSTTDDTGTSLIRFKLYDSNTVNAATLALTGEVRLIPAPPGGFSYDFIVVDLGYIDLPPSNNTLSTDPLGNYQIILEATVPASKTVKIHGLVLLPTDEWTAEVGGQMDGIGELHVDAITTPKKERGFQYGKKELMLATNGLPALRAHARQRLWFLFNFVNSGTASNAARPDYIASVQLYKAQRYRHLRGD